MPTVENRIWSKQWGFWKIASFQLPKEPINSWGMYPLLLTSMFCGGFEGNFSEGGLGAGPVLNSREASCAKLAD